MTTVIAPPDVVPSVPGYRDADGPLAAGGVSSRMGPRGPVPEGDLRHLFAAVGGLGEAVLAAYAVPVIILAIGIPIALFVRLVMLIVGAR